MLAAFGWGCLAASCWCSARCWRSRGRGAGAGALLVMLIDSMIPAATRDAGRRAGLLTALGFALAALLSSLS